MRTSKGLLLKSLSALIVLASVLSGCSETPPRYGLEIQTISPLKRREVWAVAPVINLSGYAGVDPLLQADLLYQQLQQVRGLTVIPVNRVAEVYARLNIDRVQNEQQAAIVRQLLGCDRLIVATVTAYDPYVPPKMGASLALMSGTVNRTELATDLDPRELARLAAPKPDEPVAPAGGESLVQAVGMFDAANGSVREALFRYAAGRNDPVGPMGAREYLASMDRYCGFVYHELAAALIARAERTGTRRRS